MDYTQLHDEYKTRLTESVLSFWLKYGMDSENGGIYTALDRDGTLLDTDKSVWFQGRALWSFASAYTDVEPREEYLPACESLVRFIEAHCFDTDGRMFFRVTKDGLPVIKRIRYFFSETFAVLGMAAYSRALQKAGKLAEAEKMRVRSYQIFEKILYIKNTPGILIPKFNPENASARGFGVPMILLNTAQELRKAYPEKEAELTAFIDGLLTEIQTYFIRPELETVLEQCAPDGRFQAEHFEGRLLNPGHAIEGSWFVMNEARYRNNDAKLIKLGTQMLDWMWKRGWDSEYGGIIYYRDALGKSATEYWHDMKFWWPQTEAVIANLMAYSLTDNKKYEDQFKIVHEYAHKLFPDPEYGEWFGYFHRDGSLSTPLKGNMYKGPFHIPRMYIVCLELLKKVCFQRCK